MNHLSSAKHSIKCSKHRAADELEAFDNKAPLGLREVTLEAVMLLAQESKV